MSQTKLFIKREQALFQEAMQGVKRLYPDKIRLSSPLPPPCSLSSITDDSPPLPSNYFSLSEGNYLPLVGHEAECIFKQNCISHKILQRLRRGYYRIEATLDLHRLSSQEARILVDQMLYYALSQHLQVIRIIHGKGLHSSSPPVLKNKLNHWLREVPAVLAFCSTKQATGGTGALDVLLKNLIKNKSKGENICIKKT